MASVSYFYVFKDSQGQWRWNFTSTNGNIIATGAEGYHNLADCEHGISLVKAQAPSSVTVGDPAYKALRPY